MSEHPTVTEEMVEAAMRSYYGYQSSREPENARIRAAWLKALEAAQAVAPPNALSVLPADEEAGWCEMWDAKDGLVDRIEADRALRKVFADADAFGTPIRGSVAQMAIRRVLEVLREMGASSPAAPATSPFNPAFDPDVPSSHEVIVRRAVRYVLTRLAYWCDLQRDQMLYRREIEAWRDEHLPPLEPDVPVPAPFRAAPATPSLDEPNGQTMAEWIVERWDASGTEEGK